MEDVKRIYCFGRINKSEVRRQIAEVKRGQVSESQGFKDLDSRPTLKV
jgi:hypothetical protein